MITAEIIKRLLEFRKDVANSTESFAVGMAEEGDIARILNNPRSTPRIVFTGGGVFVSGKDDKTLELFLGEKGFAFSFATESILINLDRTGYKSNEILLSANMRSPEELTKFFDDFLLIVKGMRNL